jgi:hypothetical protein
MSSDSGLASIYANYTQFSDYKILNGEEDTIEETLSKLTGKNYVEFADKSFTCYYPDGEFSKEHLYMLSDAANGYINIFEVMGDGYDT